MERLQRVLASYGLTSRRKAEELILDGRVTVDGQVVRELGLRVDPARQQIRVDGQLVKPERRRYIMLNKPPGYITTANDERGRRTVLDLVKVPERVVPVGRLDRPTSGLLLLTNDGELLYRVTHPRFELEKEYEVLVDGHPPPRVFQELRRGVLVDGDRVQPSQVRPLRNEEAGTVMRIVIHEGRNRIVRRMLERVGYPVVKLERTRVGPLHVRGLAVGAWRDLTAGELDQLRSALHLVDEDVRVDRPERRERSPAPARRFGGPPSRTPSGPGGRPSEPGPAGRRSSGDRNKPPSRPARGRQEETAGRTGGPSGPKGPGRKPGERQFGPNRPNRPSGDRDRRPGGGGQKHGRPRRRPSP